MYIFVIRERVDYHNTDPQDNTYLYSNGDVATQKLASLYNDAEEYFTEDDWCEIVNTGRIHDKNGQFFETDSDDAYQVWIEELEVDAE